MKLCKRCKWENQCNIISDYTDKLLYLKKECGLKITYTLDEYCDSFLEDDKDV